MQSTPKRRMTTPGLGERGARDQKVTIKEEEAVPVGPQNISCPEPLVPDALASKATIRNPSTSSAPPASADPISAPPVSTQKAKKRTSSRPSPVRVDDVGGAAMKIASRNRISSAPRLAKVRMDASKAPLDSQSAHVLSLIDGMMSIEGLADCTGIPIERVSQIIERLERLGFVAGH